VPLGQHGAGIRQPVGPESVEHDPAADPGQRIPGQRPVGALEAAPVGGDHPEQPVRRSDQLALQPARRMPDVGDYRRVANAPDLGKLAAVDDSVGAAEVDALKAGRDWPCRARDRRLGHQAQATQRRRALDRGEVERAGERPVLRVGIDEQRLDAGLRQPPGQPEGDESAAGAALRGRYDNQSRAHQLMAAARACSGDVIGAAPDVGAGAVVSTAANRSAPAA